MKSEHKLLHLRLLVVIALVIGSVIVGGVPVFAQPTGTVTSAVSPSDATPEVGDTITVAINIDMTGVDAPDNYLGSYTATIAWDPAILNYISNGGPPAGFMGVVNDTNKDAGIIVFNAINSAGATGNVIVLTLTFDVVGTGTSVLDLEYSAMSSAGTYEKLLDILTIDDGQVVVSSAPPTCYALTLTHTGIGSNPVADPPNSAGCSAGQYVEGAVVGLTASPASGWSVGSWAGTDNDASTSTTNQVTMPAAAHTATVNYVEVPPTCYALTLTHTGSGSDPVANPPNSAGCSAGQYVEGAGVGLTASPAAGWTVGSWAGTDNNSSTATTNQVTMPAAAHTATVNYVESGEDEVVSSATPSDDEPEAGDQIVVTINIDMSSAPAHMLGSFTGSLVWNPAVLAYDSHSDLPTGFTGMVNTANVGIGQIAFNGANQDGATGNVVVIQITFDVVGPGTSALNLEYSVMSGITPNFESLIPILTVNDGQVDVASVGFYTLTMAVGPTGGGTTDPAVGPHSYATGTVVDITATPNTGYGFDYWEGDVANPGAASTTVTMNMDKTVTAHFVDTAPPDTIILTHPDNPSNSSDATFTFTSDDPEATFVCRLDEDAITPCTSPQTYSGLADGEHRFRVRATDAAGNNDPTSASYVWTIDTGVPDTTITDQPDDPSNSADASFSFSSTKPGSTFECVLDAGGITPCTSPQAYTGLADGEHTFEVRAFDAIGTPDPSPASYTWTIDTVAPDTNITDQPDNPSDSANASFSFTSDDLEATFECRLDEALFGPCTSPQAYTGLADGEHTFRVRATDAAGNTDTSPASYTWTIDTVAPDTNITDQPDDPSNSANASFGFSSTETGSTFECRLDGGTFSACTSPQTYAGLIDGSHTFEVQATGPAGNTDPTPASYTWTIDTVPPDTNLTDQPDDPSDSADASFGFNSTETGSTFECRLDGGTFSACSSPQAYTGLVDGIHTFEVRAIDAAGNTDPTPASYTWTINTAPPDTTITDQPDDPSDSPDASFSFTSNKAGSTFECQLDGSGFSACSSPQAYTGLADGEHTFEVRAIDTLGAPDPSPASYTWTIDTAAPDTNITDQPDDPSNSANASFGFTATETGSTFECRLDGGTFGPCTSPQAYTGLADGEHTFEVRAIGPVGNTDPTPASYTWTIDTVPPNTNITDQPDDPSIGPDASFSFNSTETWSTFECRLDGGTFSACTSPQAYTGLADGEHTFEVRATDAAGNTDPTPASYTWTIDTVAADTTITAHPDDPCASANASFSFTGTKPGSTFECRLDGGTFSACTSPQAYTGLADGEHTFEVRAIDTMGAPDPSPASYTWTIDTAAPDTIITAHPDDPSNSSDASFTFTSTEAVSTFECRLDGGTFGPCTSPWTYTGLDYGSHTFEVRAMDAVGNTDPTPASYTWTIYRRIFLPMVVK